MQTGRYDWSRLTRLQIGRYAEYFVKMEFTLHGFEMYTSEVDTHGIDFVVRRRDGRYYDVQVKSFRLGGKTGSNCVFVPKQKFRIDPVMLLVLVQLSCGGAPSFFLIRSVVQNQHHLLLESRDYLGRKPKPERGITLSQEKPAQLSQQCGYDSVVASM